MDPADVEVRSIARRVRPRPVPHCIARPIPIDAQLKRPPPMRNATVQLSPVQAEIAANGVRCR